MDHLQKFLVKLEEGFAFRGRQFRVRIEKEDHLIDLLFYHVKLRCYFMVELKASANILPDIQKGELPLA